ncbi:MAG TPA: GNAT family N-acetyltransferase [Anaerolineaceae bacterium]|nr:GNAT family N-acetyltransferase [Anaerolineaceae bacterium]
MEDRILSRFVTKKGTVSIVRKNISPDDYVEFLTRTDLGSQYPKERFQERITKLVNNVQISLLAIDEDGKIVGTCFGLTDFAYWLMITDLGIDRAYIKNGIGSEMIRISRTEAGGDKDIIVFIYAHEEAIPFYQKNGLKISENMMELTDVEWTDFVVTKDTISQ